MDGKVGKGQDDREGRRERRTSLTRFISSVGAICMQLCRINLSRFDQERFWILKTDSNLNGLSRILLFPWIRHKSSHHVTMLHT